MAPRPTLLRARDIPEFFNVTVQEANKIVKNLNSYGLYSEGPKRKAEPLYSSKEIKRELER